MARMTRDEVRDQYYAIVPILYRMESMADSYDRMGDPLEARLWNLVKNMQEKGVPNFAPYIEWSLDHQFENVRQDNEPEDPGVPKYVNSYGSWFDLPTHLQLDFIKYHARMLMSVVRANYATVRGPREKHALRAALRVYFDQLRKLARKLEGALIMALDGFRARR